jgi:hypothetical protein
MEKSTKLVRVFDCLCNAGKHCHVCKLNEHFVYPCIEELKRSLKYEDSPVKLQCDCENLANITTENIKNYTCSQCIQEWCIVCGKNNCNDICCDYLLRYHVCSFSSNS